MADINLAESLDQETLDRIGSSLLGAIQKDDVSRSEWMDNNQEWINLAMQVVEEKSFPWPGASNVKYPLLTLASVQFNARSLSALINNDSPVRARIVGRDDEQQTKLKRANRVSKYMSYQLLHDMEDWVDELDRMLIVLPMIGTTFKKMYFDPSSNKTYSKFLTPKEVIVNYKAKNLKTARVTCIVSLTKNEILELVRSGEFLDIDIDALQGSANDTESKDIQGNQRRGINGAYDEEDDLVGSETITLYESHCWIDLDGDGYKEPHIVVLDAEYGKVLAIYQRFQDEDIVYNEKGQIVKINPIEHFVNYIFIPDPESKIYGIGFGSLIGPINDSTNTLINQLIDGGTLSNLQSGFLLRGVKHKGGAVRLRPGEWVITNQRVDDIRKGIYPMPTKDPSPVLFNLLSLLIEAGQQIISVSDIMLGQNPGQNQPASTTMTVLEQGLKVYTSIYRRVYHALDKEVKMLYNFNRLYLDGEKYSNILDDELASPEDFTNEGIEIIPGADPTYTSDAIKVMKANSLLEKAGAGLPINPVEATRRVLEAEGHDDIENIMQVPEPQPDPELILKQEELKHKVEKDRFDQQIEMARLQYDAIGVIAQAISNIAKAEAQEQGSNLAQYQTIVDQLMQREKLANERFSTLLGVASKQVSAKDKESTQPQ